MDNDEIPLIQAKIFAANAKPVDDICVFESTNQNRILEFCYRYEWDQADGRNPVLVIPKDKIIEYCDWSAANEYKETSTDRQFLPEPFISQFSSFLSRKGLTQPYLQNAVKKSIGSVISHHKQFSGIGEEIPVPIENTDDFYRELLAQINFDSQQGEVYAPLGQLRASISTDFFDPACLTFGAGLDRSKMIVADDLHVDVDQHRLTERIIKGIIEKKLPFGPPKQHALHLVKEWQSSIQNPRVKQLCNLMLMKKNLEVYVVMDDGLEDSRLGMDGQVRNLPMSGFSSRSWPAIGINAHSFYSVLVHELAHQAINMTWNNDSKPFSDSEDFVDKSPFIHALQQDLQKINTEHAFDRLRKDLGISKQFYRHGDYYAEIPARIIDRMGTGEWKSCGLDKRYPHLTKLTDELIDKMIKKLASPNGPHSSRVCESTNTSPANSR